MKFSTTKQTWRNKSWSIFTRILLLKKMIWNENQSKNHVCFHVCSCEDDEKRKEEKENSIQFLMTIEIIEISFKFFFENFKINLEPNSVRCFCCCCYCCCFNWSLWLKNSFHGFFLQRKIKFRHLWIKCTVIFSSSFEYINSTIFIANISEENKTKPEIKMCVPDEIKWAKEKKVFAYFCFSNKNI